MGVTVAANKRTLVHAGSGGMSVAFPDVCLTPVGPAIVPIPYPNIARSATASKGATRTTADGKPVLIASSIFASSNGDEPGVKGGVVSQVTRGQADMITKSGDVIVEGKGVIRAFDLCLHNKKNTPPFPILQAPAVALGGSAKPTCVRCGKTIDPKKPEGHVPDVPEKDLHDRSVQRGKTDGGACLWAHVPGYVASSCCHAWQAHQAAQAGEGSRSWYDTHEDGAWSPATTGNFTNRQTPFWHDVHHVIPPRLLSELIDDTDASDPGAARYCRLALLSAGYNINHGRNLLILPLTKKAAERLVLPRRLVVDAATLGIPPAILAAFAGKNLYEEVLTYFLKPVITALAATHRDPGCSKPGPSPGAVAKIAFDKISGLVGDAILLPNLIAGKGRSLARKVAR
jgi:hypothetical protein